MRVVAKNLEGSRGGQPVFNGVGFDLGHGEALVITGPNGTGKSTLLRICAGLLEPSAGSIRLTGGGEAWPDMASASHFLSSDNAMKTALTVAENLEFWKNFHGEEHMEIGDALGLVGLEQTSGLPYGYLSTGQKRRISIARLLVSWRPVWLLDEPTAGLDEASEAQFAELMAVHLEDGGIIIAATHTPLGLDNAATLELEHAS